jgi:hypothetical protein
LVATISDWSLMACRRLANNKLANRLREVGLYARSDLLAHDMQQFCRRVSQRRRQLFPHDTAHVGNLGLGEC